jgi:hypothetical protein
LDLREVDMGIISSKNIIRTHKPHKPDVAYSSDFIDYLIGQDGVTVEDEITRIGVECDYLGNSMWLIAGKQYDSMDVRSFLKQQEGYQG